MSDRNPASWEETPPLKEAMGVLREDPNAFWFMDSGHALNLLEAAFDEVEQLTVQRQAVQALHEPARWYTDPGPHPGDCPCVEIEDGCLCESSVFDLVCVTCSTPWPCATFLATGAGDE